VEHADGGVLADVAQLGRRLAGDVTGGARHRFQIGVSDADVAAGVKASAEGFHQPAEIFECLPALERGMIEDNDLAAAGGQLGQRGLVGHPAGQAQDVAKRVGFGGVAPDADAAQRRAERGVVDGQKAAQARGAILKRHHLFVIVLGERREDFHSRESFGGRAGGVNRQIVAGCGASSAAQK
jgi:hypothetical protein